MNEMSFYVERLDLAQSMARFYWVGVEPTLFGDWVTVCWWGGRIGTDGRRQEQWYATYGEALQAAHEAVRRKRRRGYRPPAESRAVHVAAAAVSPTAGRATPTSRA
ncbi:WGR domain-containing protein [Salinisphaera sp. RV14]|uniref:WGR domain-containing protein n=1 Tax=unclassified Salinisphaera TaxID=2649847 RepID=UPI003F8377AF